MTDKLALVIGCGYSHNKMLSLSGTINDAKNIRLFLEQNGYNVTNMNDEKYTENDTLYPNKKNILLQIKKLLMTAVDRNINNCVIYFAGHGIQDEFNHNPNESDGKDECIIPASFDINDPSTVIKDDDINDILNNTIKNKSKMKLFMLFDCCHSATNADLRYTYDHNGRQNVPPNLSFKTDIDASIIKLSGCMDKASSFETIINGQTQGILTSSFIKILTEDISLTKDIFLISRLIYKYTSKYGQSPCVSSSKNLNDNINFRSILNHNVNDDANVFSDDDDINEQYNDNTNMNIETLFKNDNTNINVDVLLNDEKKTQSQVNNINNIDMFGPMASAFTKVSDLSYNDNVHNNQITYNANMIENLNVSSFGLLKYLV